MSRRSSYLLVALVASMLTLLGSSLVARGGTSSGSQAPCGIAVGNPCPQKPLLQVTAPSKMPALTLSDGKYLVWMEGQGRFRQLNPGHHKLTGCVLYRDKGLLPQAVVLDPFKDTAPLATEDVRDLDDMYEVLDDLYQDSLPLRAPPQHVVIGFTELSFSVPYQPVLVEVPNPGQGVLPPIAPPATSARATQAAVATLSAACTVQLRGTQRRVDVDNARIYALRVGS